VHKILFYSGNPGKTRELQEKLQTSEYTLISAKDKHINTGIEETGTTFIENAIIKARDGANQAKMPCIADDSGLIVDCLNGEPGLYSSEYAGKQKSSSDHIQKLLKVMQPYSGLQRSARFYCCLVYLRNEMDPNPIIAEGICQGLILDQARGDHGFGYDPVFYIPELRQTLAEMPLETKQTISHRASAVEILKNKLREAYRINQSKKT